MGGFWDIPYMDYEPDKSKWLAKENQEEMLHKRHSNYHKGATQRLSESRHVSIHRYCTLFFSLLINKYILKKILFLFKKCFFPPLTFLFKNYFTAKLKGQGPCLWLLVALTTATWAWSLPKSPRPTSSHRRLSRITLRLSYSLTKVILK